MRLTLLDAATGARQRDALADLLVACVEGGASISFMAGLTVARAAAFWGDVIAKVDAGERLLIAAMQDDRLVGTVQVIHRLPENQPHRAEIAKLLVSPTARKHGVGRALMEFAEARARELGKTLMTLDTVEDSPADRLYRTLGYTAAGIIPNYALLPDGRPCPTVVFWKDLAGGAPPR
jgi:GNAT superfamily N-acetyltransferase